MPPRPVSADPRSDPVFGSVALDEATDRLLATARQLDDEQLAGPSLCPGWSRAHVLGHLARNADALSRLCTWAATGTPTPMYDTAENRAREIGNAAAQAPADLLADLSASARRFALALAEMPESAWTSRVRLGPAGTGAEVPAARIGWQRLKEVEIHHVDLDHGYSPADWPTGFVDRALTQTLRMFERRDDVPALVVRVTGSEPVALARSGGPVVTGAAPTLLAWLTGRSRGDALTVDPPGPPPRLPPWA